MRFMILALVAGCSLDGPELGAQKFHSTSSDLIGYEFTGHFTFEYDGSSGVSLDFEPIPIGSAFSGCLSYEIDAPQTSYTSSIALYYDTPTGWMSLTANGHTFETKNRGYATPFIQVGSSYGFVMGTQPLSMPADWTVSYDNAYFTVRRLTPDFLPQQGDPVPTSLSVDSGSELVLDFLYQNPITYPGGSYTGRPILRGTIETLTLGGCGRAATLPLDELVLSLNLPGNSANGLLDKAQSIMDDCPGPVSPPGHFDSFCNEISNNPNISDIDEAEILSVVEELCGYPCP